MIRNVSRSTATAVVVALLVLLAGCSGLTGSSGETPTETTESQAPAETTDTTSSMDDETETESSSRNLSTGSEGDAQLSGRMILVIDGNEHHLDTSAAGSFWFNETSEHTWHASEPMALDAALEEADVDASEESLSYDGETYSESDENTTITYRVAGTEFEDPSAYELEDLNPAHEIMIHVDTDTERQVPGREIQQSHPHAHGQLNVAVEGQQLDLSKDRYEMEDEHFHFHGDEGAARWHAHSLNVTTGYAVSTFSGMNLTDDSFTYEGTTYGEDTEDTTLNVTVDGEPVDPETYVLKDGDTLEVTVNHTSDSGDINT